MMLLLHTIAKFVTRLTLTANSVLLSDSISCLREGTGIADAIRIDIYTRFASKQVVDNLWITCG